MADWYLDNNTSMTLKEVYAKWLVWKETPRNGDNIKRIKASWKAYYSNEPLSKDIIEKPMSSLTSLMLREWASALLKKHYSVDKKNFLVCFPL